MKNSSVVLLKVKNFTGNLGEPINSKLSRLNSVFFLQLLRAVRQFSQLCMNSISVFSKHWLVMHNIRVHLEIQ